MASKSNPKDIITSPNPLSHPPNMSLTATHIQTEYAPTVAEADEL